MPETPHRTFGAPTSLDDDPYLEDSDGDDVVDSDDLVAEEEPAADAGTSDLAELRRELDQTPDQAIVLEVPGRNITLTFAADLSMTELDSIRRRANRRTQSGKRRFDAVRAAALMLAEKSTGIAVNGRRQLDSDGDPLTLRSPELLSMVGSATATEAVRAVYGADGPMLIAGNRVLTASGFADEDDDSDGLGPTG